MANYRNYRYGEYDGGPDPLAAPYDVRGALDDMGDDILGGGTPAEALRDLLRRGWQGRRGLDDLLRKVRERSRELRSRGRLDGMLEQARALLDTAIGQERAELFPDPSDDARPRGSARRTWTRCRMTPRARSGSWRTMTGGRRRPGRRSTSSATCCARRCWTASSAA